MVNPFLRRIETRGDHFNIVYLRGRSEKFSALWKSVKFMENMKDISFWNAKDIPPSKSMSRIIRIWHAGSQTYNFINTFLASTWIPFIPTSLGQCFLKEGYKKVEKKRVREGHVSASSDTRINSLFFAPSNLVSSSLPNCFVPRSANWYFFASRHILLYRYLFLYT